MMSNVSFFTDCNNETVVTNARYGYLVHSMYPLGYGAGICKWEIRAQENEVSGWDILCFLSMLGNAEYSNELGSLGKE